MYKRRHHWTTVKRIFRYLWGTNDYAICYEEDGGKNLHLHRFADWADDMHNGNSTSAYVFILFQGALSWRSKRKQVVAQSSTEAENIAVS